MHDQPKPTEEENEQAPDRMGEEEAKQYPSHEAPERPGEDTEIHDA
jgi:hypothetical protein